MRISGNRESPLLLGDDPSVVLNLYCELYTQKALGYIYKKKKKKPIVIQHIYPLFYK